MSRACSGNNGQVIALKTAMWKSRNCDGHSRPECDSWSLDDSKTLKWSTLFGWTKTEARFGSVSNGCEKERRGAAGSSRRRRRSQGCNKIEGELCGRISARRMLTGLQCWRTRESAGQRMERSVWVRVRQCGRTRCERSLARECQGHGQGKS